ncbi:hypothetical protein BJX76DRAFT_356491 [Aspergillus varians]
MLQNGCSMLCPVWDDLTKGPLAPLAAVWEDDLGVTADPKDPLLTTLFAAVATENPSNYEYEAYREAAVKLTMAFAYLRPRGSAATIWDALNAWPMRVAPPYLALLRQSRPGALLLLAYYIKSLSRMQGATWDSIDVLCTWGEAARCIST